jgi:sterol 3beta-glucosyltransferase
VPEKVLERSTSNASSANQDVARLAESVRITLSPLSIAGSARGSPRASGEFSRSNSELTRHSADFVRETLRTNTMPERHSTDSGQHRRVLSGSSIPTDFSFGDSSDTARLSSDDEGTQPASNILSGSEVFHSPTMETYRSKGRSSRHQESISPHGTIRASSRRRMLRRYRGPPEDSDSDASATADGKESPRLQDIVKSGTFPLQRAAGWADWMKRRSKKMGSLLASQPMGYLEKVSDMWAGGRRHYRDPMGMMPDEKVEDDGSHQGDEDASQHDDRFRTRFALPETERLVSVYFGYLHRVLPLYGKIYLGNRHFCFRSMLPGTKTKMILPLKDVENVDKEKGFRFGYSGLVITIRGHEELFFEFGQADARDDCAVTLLQNVEDVRHLAESGFLSKEEKQGAEAARKEHQMLQDARQDDLDSHDLQLPTKADGSYVSEAPPIVFDDPHGSFLNFKPTEPMHITCLTIGSRGDVQPFISLCKGLMKDGHKTRIATHLEFKDWIEGHGIEFAEVGGDPAELMQLCVEYGMFTVEFLRVTTSKVSPHTTKQQDFANYR